MKLYYYPSMILLVRRAPTLVRRDALYLNRDGVYRATELAYQGRMLSGVTLEDALGALLLSWGEFHSEAPTVQVTAMLDTGACNTKPAGGHQSSGFYVTLKWP